MSATPPLEQLPRDWARRLAWLPIPLLLATMAVLWVADLQTAYPAPYLQMALNFVTRTLASLVIAYLAGRGFLVRGNPGLLLLGCGVAIWGAAGLVATALVTRDVNLSVTISNLGLWLSALCYLASAILLIRPTRAMRPAALWLGVGYTLALGLAGLVTLATFAGALPVFFVQGQGGTLVRYIVLGSAMALFALAAVLLWEANRPSLSPFTNWYILALLLIAAAQPGLMALSFRNTPLDWTCRAAQYLGGVYMLIAALAARGDPGLRGITPARARDAVRYPYGVAVAIVLAATVLRLAFLPALGTRAIFLTFYPAVMLAALYGGLRAGLLATLLSALAADYFFIGPPGFAVGDAGDWLALAVFLASCTMICGIVEALQRARVRAAAAEAETRFADERVRATDALRASEARLNRAQQIANVGSWEWDIESGALTWSEQTYRLMGAPPGWFAPSHAAFVQRIHPADRAAFDVAIKQALAKIAPYDLELRIVQPGGAVRVLQTRGEVVCGPDGRPQRMIGVCLDITERKAAEEEIGRQMVELSAANDELARFNRAAVGRELHMIELKRQVNELCRQAGQPACYALEFAADPAVPLAHVTDSDPASVAEGKRDSV